MKAAKIGGVRMKIRALMVLWIVLALAGIVITTTDEKDDAGSWPWEHPECIMNYYYAWLGTDKWCDEHWNVIYGNINGLWE